MKVETLIDEIADIAKICEEAGTSEEGMMEALAVIFMLCEKTCKDYDSEVKP